MLNFGTKKKIGYGCMDRFWRLEMKSQREAISYYTLQYANSPQNLRHRKGEYGLQKFVLKPEYLHETHVNWIHKCEFYRV